MENITEQECYKIVQGKIKSDDFEIVNWTSKAPEVRNGFLGDHFSMNIEIKMKSHIQSNKEEKHKKFAFFAKGLPVNEEQRLLVKQSKCFEKEVMFYKLLSYEYSRILGEVKLFPKYYFARNDIIVMEDIGISGFRNEWDTREKLSYTHCKQVVLAMARFHACSLVLEEKQKIKITECYPKMIYETVYTRDCSKFYEFFLCGIEAVVDLVPEVPKYKDRPEIIFRAQEIIPTLMHELHSLVLADSNFRNVFCHGDVWSSNLIFRFEGNEPKQAAFVDFQCLRFCPPAHDIMAFLHLSMKRDERRKYALTLIDMYYSELGRELKRHDLDIGKIIPREEFDKSCRKQQLAGCILPLVYYPVTHMNKGVMEEVVQSHELFQRYFYMNRTPEVKQHFKTDPTFSVVMNEAMEDMIDIQVLNENNYLCKL